MFCKNCGKSLDETANFCTYCGQKIDKSEPELTEIQNGFTKEDIESLNSNELDVLIEKTPNNEKEPSKNNEKRNVEELLSILFGFASLICAPFISVFSIPMSLSGIIFGGYSKNKYNKKFSVGKILNYVSLAVAIVTFVLSCLFVTNTAKLINDSNVIPNFQIKYNTGLNNEIKENKNTEIFEYPEDTTIVKNEKEKIKPVKTQTINMEKVTYSIPTNWELHSLNSTIVNNNIKTVHEFSTDTDYAIIREFSVSDFYKDDLIQYINQTLNGINSENTFTKNNLLWNNIITNSFVVNGEIYTANILYTNIDNVIFMIEIQSNINSQASINSTIETIINSLN